MKRMLAAGKKYYMYALGALALVITLILLLSLYLNLELTSMFVLLLYSVVVISTIIIFQLFLGNSIITVNDDAISVGSLINKCRYKYYLSDLKEVKVKRIYSRYAYRKYIVMNFSDTPLSALNLSEFYRLPNLIFIGDDKTNRKIVDYILSTMPKHSISIDID